MLFSQRHGYKPAKKAIQIESLDQETRNAIWNVFSSFFVQFQWPFSIYKHLWENYFKQPIDSVPVPYETGTNRNEKFYLFFREYVLSKATWNECFDFSEYIVSFIQAHIQELRKAPREIGYEKAMFSHVEMDINKVFERESVGYRFVSGNITPTTSEEELSSIDTAITDSSDPVSIHLKNALSKLTDRKHPDYPNSVKESISAVEAQCSLILGKTTTLGEALKQIEKSHPLHSCLREAFCKLYGYASDAGGIRHGGIKTEEVDSALALFMLVSCSAFINYLKNLK